MVTDSGLDSAKGGGHREEWQEVKPTGPGCGLDVGSNGWGAISGLHNQAYDDNL